jgi:antitoxin Phd
MVATGKFERRKKAADDGRIAHASGGWKLEDAKARFSEVVRLARSEGPQRVSVRGKDAVVVMSVEELERLAPPTPRTPLIAFLEGLNLADLALDREQDHGRDIDL